MYVMEYRPPIVGSGPIVLELWEMTRPAFARLVVENTPDSWNREVSAAVAHRFIERGGLNNTPLWVDENGRIRRSQGEAE